MAGVVCGVSPLSHECRFSAIISGMLLFGSATDSILKASRGERQEAIEKLIFASTFRRGYYLLLILSVLIVTPGLALDNAGVIIGGMVMAPLLAPILLLALSIVSRSARGAAHAAQVLLFSVCIVLGLSALLGWILVHTTDAVRWIPDHIPAAVYVFIAFCSGIAAAFAWVKEDLAPTIAGIAISVALLPPLCAVGIGIAFTDIPLARNSFLLFASNFLGILLAALLVFLLLGFHPEQKTEEKALSNAGVE